MVTRVEFMHLLLLLCAPVIYDHVVQEQQNPRGISALGGQNSPMTQALRALGVDSKMPEIGVYICDKAHFDPNQKNLDETSSVSL